MSYSTKQQLAVLHCLKERQEEALGAGELLELLHKEGTSVGLATVYRQLEKLVEAGKLHKIRTAQGALYQYCPVDHDEDCFLLRCRVCGRVQHLECPHLQELYLHLAQEHRFHIDSRRTVLTGLCEDCAKKEALHGGKASH